jgi:hypothetical protein
MAGLMEFLFSGRILLIFGAILLYTASRAAVAALAGGESAPGQRAVGHWIPIAAAAVVAVIFRRGDLALSIIFASSVGCLSLLVGSICIVKPSFDAPGEYRRFWPFVLPAGLLTLLAGFAGSLSWRQALMFFIEGGALYFAWQELGSRQTVIATDVDVPASERRQPAVLRWAVVAVCILLSIVGAIAGILGAERISQGIPAVSDVATVVAVLGPLLVLPMLLSGAQLAQSDRGWAAITSGVMVVLLNLCVLLPIVILLWYPLQSAPNMGFGNVVHVLGSAGPLPFSWVTWRVDNVILVLLAFPLFPASMGRWRMGRPEGLTLIAIYAVYVLMEAAGNMRS